MNRQGVAYSSHVQQNQHTEISKVQTLRDAAKQALAGLDEYEIDDEDADDVRRAAQRALDEPRTPTNSVSSGLNGTVGPAAAASALNPDGNRAYASTSIDMPHDPRGRGFGKCHVITA